jgi:hypothetical protein
MRLVGGCKRDQNVGRRCLWMKRSITRTVASEGELKTQITMGMSFTKLRRSTAYEPDHGEFSAIVCTSSKPPSWLCMFHVNT